MANKLILKDLSWATLNPLTSMGKGAEYLNLKEISCKDGLIRARIDGAYWTSISNPYAVEIQLLETGEATKYTCTCDTKTTDSKPLCKHHALALQEVARQYGENYRGTLFRDYSKEKEVLLGQYGLTLATYKPADFEFSMNKGVLTGKKLNVSIQPIATPMAQWQGMLTAVLAPADREAPVSTESIADERFTLFGLLLKGFQATAPVLFIRSFSASRAKNGKYVSLKDFNDHTGKAAIPPRLSVQDMEVFGIDNSLDARGYERKITALAQVDSVGLYRAVAGLPPDLARAVAIHEKPLADKLLSMIPHLDDRFFLIDPTHTHVTKVDVMTRVEQSGQVLTPRFVVQEDGDMVALRAFLRFEEEEIPYHEYTESHSFWLWQRGTALYRLASLESGMLLRLLDAYGRQIMVGRKGLQGFLEHLVAPLTQQNAIDFELTQHTVTAQWPLVARRIYLRESEGGLRFVPAFVYHDGTTDSIEVPANGGSSRASFSDGTLYIHLRDTAAEEAFMELLQRQHPLFEMAGTPQEFYLPSEELLQDGWFFSFNETMRKHGADIMGFNSLKKFRYNPNRAVTRVQVASGIDWFDMKVEVSFGDQMVAVSDIRKAIVNRKNYVNLADGSIGLLPEEWLNRYSEALRMAQVKGDQVKLSKRHFMLMELLREDIDQDSILQELDEKREKLLNFRQIADTPLPKTVKATLRQYQVEGYKWLNFLDEFGWGGILADDMGLGKTLQVLTFLAAVSQRNKKALHLIVLPKSLIFNWQAEVEKFCPHLKVLPYHGSERKPLLETFAKYDLILTTYGTLRSDIAELKAIKFHYVVLDESQAIKNPGSQVSQAVRLLKAKNRLAMTGTPIENNTFDLWSQFEFLNPGFLGGAEFFREEFANPIDRSQNKEKAAALRKLVYPFMLKRTKEEVATDLPAKVESIIFCEMGDTQRRVYDQYREKFRVMLADKMATEGREKSAFLILEGLLKLRQICDSPALLNGGDDGELPTDSVKLEEIVREIQENTSGHKILIFSQFIGMLSLIRAHLEREDIAYEYLDGQTQDRAGRVDSFQANDTVRVFLMSLKAGGVGLNLTSADYVYLIDPWWNPAVEAQAIDRAHRIGQTKSVFAYRMICKDTVEEKIMQLQAKKQAIAGDVVDAEAGFLKSLSKDDVLGLFA